MTYTDKILSFRQQRDEFMFNSTESPLTTEFKTNYSNLDYFPINIKFRLKGNFKPKLRPKEQEYINLTGKNQIIHRVGKLKFTIQDKELSLQVFKYPTEPIYFVAFGDFTNKTKESYPAGRYVQLDDYDENESTFIIDFNKAISPYCLYNELFICPVIPDKNKLFIRIDAGEKNLKSPSII